MKSILITGGAGYIGSHTVLQLLQQGYEPVVVDNLSNGCKESLPGRVTFYQIDVRDRENLRPVFAKHNFSAVIHLAALALVEESFQKPNEYLDHNVNGTLSVLELCREHKVKNFIFSSSSTIYGDSNRFEKLTELHNISPISPYGKSKKLCEEKLNEYAVANSEFNFICLRYFNVAGASSDLTHGPRGTGSDRLIFNTTKAAVYGGSGFKINGNDYQTDDGTCVRDYIHVEDISDIHVLALNYLQENNCKRILNCGYGNGFSVKQIVETFKKTNNVDFSVEYGPRREGDPAYLVGDSRALVKLLNWKSRFTDPLESICRSSYLWEKNRAQ